MQNLANSERDRFDSKWIKVGDCHLWQGPLDRDGYGTFYLRGKGRRAHRVAWYDFHGEIPDGMVINHTCRVRNCVNVQHLNLVTVYDNAMRDSTTIAYLNSQKEHCPLGHPYKKVTWGGRPQRVCQTCSNARSRRNKKALRDRDTLKV